MRAAHLARLVRLVAGGLVLATLLVGPASAEIRRMEAVGSEPIDPTAPRARAPRDGATQRALLEAVSRVAAEFLMDEPVERDAFGSSEPPEGATTPGGNQAPPNYSKIFGRNLVQYTTHYRILEDRGEQPALFAEDSRVQSEYVVIVEVNVDADRVRHRLEEAGLLAAVQAVSHARRIVLEVQGLSVYPAYQELRRVLVEEIGATRVVPLEFSRDRVRLGVEYASGGPRELLDDLYARSPRQLEITPVLSDELQLTISVQWIPNSSSHSEGISPRSPGAYDSLGHGARSGVAGTAERRSPPASGRARENAPRVDTGSRNRY